MSECQTAVNCAERCKKKGGDCDEYCGISDEKTDTHSIKCKKMGFTKPFFVPGSGGEQTCYGPYRGTTTKMTTKMTTKD